MPEVCCSAKDESAPIPSRVSALANAQGTVFEKLLRRHIGLTMNVVDAAFEVSA
jgi:hypothetical protein